jgi:hypothetical protein
VLVELACIFSSSRDWGTDEHRNVEEARELSQVRFPLVFAVLFASRIRRRNFFFFGNEKKEIYDLAPSNRSPSSALPVKWNPPIRQHISEWMNFSAPGKGEKFTRIWRNRVTANFESAPAKPVG